MLTVIPLCGFGERFADYGFPIHKPLLPIHGYPMIYTLIDRIKSSSSHILCVCPAAFRNHDLHHPHATFVYLSQPTKGAIDTAVKGIKLFLETSSHDHMCEPVVVMDGDVLYNVDILGLLEPQLASGVHDFSVAVVKDVSQAACFSFITMDEQCTVTQIAEKKRVSDWAITGVYGFANLAKFMHHAVQTLANPMCMQKGEYYMSSLIHVYIEKHLTGKAVVLQPSEVLCCGTPLQLTQMTQYITSTPRRFCFGLNGTLITHDNKPIIRNIEFVRALKKQGHTVIIHAENRDIEHILAKLEIPYDEVYYGRPKADYHIDYNAVPAGSELCKWTGVFPWKTAISARSFNSVTVDPVNSCVRKRSADRDKILAEVEYYRNIPMKVRDLFPVLLEVYDDGYSTELVSGNVASRLYVTETLTDAHLDYIIAALARLHKEDCADTDADALSINGIYFSQRFRQRTLLSRSRFPFATTSTFESLCQRCADFLNAYEQGPSTLCMIHGDPVFTNILFVEGGVRFIDMRGCFNGHVTIYGDPIYDYAKIYQSLVGYDEIVLQHYVSPKYKARMLSVFWDLMGIDPVLRESIRMMTICLLVSLMPLHDEYIAKSCYELAIELDANN